MAGHKYIDKIIKNGKTRYFYTMEELNAYKKALSSKDEEKAFIRANNVKRKPTAGNGVNTRKEQIKTAYARTYGSKMNLKKAKNPAEFGKKMGDYVIRKKTMDDYEKAKTVKGKIDDVIKVLGKYHPETAKKVEKGRKKVDRVVKEMKGYKNALSSKDEADKYIKSAYGEDKKVTNKNRDKLVKKINNDYKKTNKLMKKEGMVEYLEYEDPNLMKQYKNTEKKKRDYEKAKTTKGKIEDLKKNYKKYHPSKNNKKKKN